MNEIAALVATLEVTLRRAGDPDRAEGARRYLKSDLVFVGVSAPELRRALDDTFGRRAGLAPVTLWELVETLWGRRVFELRAAAVELLVRHSGSLPFADIGRLEALLRRCRTWALVDPLAINVASELAARHPALVDDLGRWARDADFWLRRAALLALLKPLRRGGGDFASFSRWADGMLEEREFFIRKAIGWVLREVAKKRPELVISWLEPRLPRVSGVTVREAARHLPPGSRDRLLAAYRAAGSGVRSRRQ